VPASSVRFVTLVLVVSGLSAAGCQRTLPPDMRSILPGVQPFSDLPEIRLGMTAGELAAFRTTVFTIPYFGYQDSVGKYLVGYNFPGAVSDDAPPPEDDRLARVGGERQHKSDAEADSAYRDRVREVSAVLGPPVECLAPVTGSTTRQITRWDVADVSVYVELSAAGGLPGSIRARLQSAATRTIVAHDPPFPRKTGLAENTSCGA